MKAPDANIHRSARAGKLLVSVVGRHRGEKLVAVSRAAGARGATIALGRAVMDSRLLQALSLADVHQEVVFSLLGDEAPGVLAAVRDAARADKKLSGFAALLDVNNLFNHACSPEPEAARQGAENMERGFMETPFQLITVIVNQGYADDVMAAARKAGATGGTILTARGTGKEDDVKFFGLTLAPEKEMLLIIAAREKSRAIMDAVGRVPKLCEPGGGIAFSLAVENFTLLGQ